MHVYMRCINSHSLGCEPESWKQLATRETEKDRSTLGAGLDQHHPAEQTELSERPRVYPPKPQCR